MTTKPSSTKTGAFTPGPWEIEDSEIQYNQENGMYESGLFVQGDDQAASIAQLCLWQSPEEAYANARLIAAAPEILKQLQRIIKHGNHQFNDNNGWWPTLTVNMFERSKAAIQAATGEEG